MEKFVENIGENSHFLNIGAGVGDIEHILAASGVIEGLANQQFSGGQEAELMDEELQIALRISLEEEMARNNQNLGDKKEEMIEAKKKRKEVKERSLEKVRNWL